MQTYACCRYVTNCFFVNFVTKLIYKMIKGRYSKFVYQHKVIKI